MPILAGEQLSWALAAGFALAAVGLSFLAPFGRCYLEVVAVADIIFLLSVKMILQGNATGAQKVLKQGWWQRWQLSWPQHYFTEIIDFCS